MSPSRVTNITPIARSCGAEYVFLDIPNSFRRCSNTFNLALGRDSKGTAQP